MNIININILSLLLLLIVVVVMSSAQPPFSDPDALLCSKNDNSSDYSEVINKVLGQLELASEHLMFNYTSSCDQSGNKSINGLAQCRGNVSQSACSSCIKNATSAVHDKNTKDQCGSISSTTDMKMWYNYCFLRYSTANFFGKVDATGLIFWNTANVTGAKAFNDTLTGLMNHISNEAVVDKDFTGKGNCPVLKSKKEYHIYGLVQCTRDLSPDDCKSCLVQATSFPQACHNKEGCRVLYASCSARYELYPF